MKTIFVTVFTLFFLHNTFAQLLKLKEKFTHSDTLRGSNGEGRNWWDVQRYNLDVKFDIEKKQIVGKVEIAITQNKEGNFFQIDLQKPLMIDSICYDYVPSLLASGVFHAAFPKESITNYENAYFIKKPQNFWVHKLIIYYHGIPQVAINPPWDGGLIWNKDAKGNPFVSVACQGKGASVWYPCKDIQSDEPDKGVSLTMTYPDDLVGVSNGKNIFTKQNNDGTVTSKWEVAATINNYCIIPYIGKYVHFGETYKGIKGDLSMDYWVLDYNLEKAKKQFNDAKKMMEAFEYWFGAYPFYEDGYKLVESPHLGMEHQSATAYGNQYLNGYLGYDMSGSGWGDKWDYIIVHESGHEWFANNITTNDIADMWVHEGFTSYSEVLFTEYFYGKQAGNEYNIGTRKGIANKETIIGPYNVNKEGSGDMYPKGANLIHTIRQVINNDSLFRNILIGLNTEFYHKTTTSAAVEKYISIKSGIDFSKIFDQYLRNTAIPKLEYKIVGKKISYRWTNCIAGFNLPIKITLDKAGKKTQTIKPTIKWQTLQLVDWYDGKTLVVDKNFYVESGKH